MPSRQKKEKKAEKEKKEEVKEVEEEHNEDLGEVEEESPMEEGDEKGESAPEEGDEKGESAPEEGDEKAKKRKKKRKTYSDAEHPPTTEMILDALADVTSPKGITVRAIRDHIMRENTVRPERLKYLLRQAYTKLEAKEFIVRPKGEENAKSVVMGRWKLAPKKVAAAGEGEARPPPVRALRSNNLDKVKKKKGKKSKKRRHY